ncbi:MAG: hypothetical protein CM1200mP30_33480 [Pseudomonadota bacterium]|nr:MAG: hypothetical protein CM1200mP30_33480 [Pseudomonadota bacterium]
MLPQKQKSYLQIFLSERAIFVGNIKFPQFAVDTPPENLSEIDQALSGGFLGFMGLAIIAGFLALLTPCVFPMIPVTVAFFTKQSHTGTRETLRLAVLFGVGIVGTYTVTGCCFQ